MSAAAPHPQARTSSSWAHAGHVRDYSPGPLDEVQAGVLHANEEEEEAKALIDAPAVYKLAAGRTAGVGSGSTRRIVLLTAAAAVLLITFVLSRASTGNRSDSGSDPQVPQPDGNVDRPPLVATQRQRHRQGIPGSPQCTGSSISALAQDPCFGHANGRLCHCVQRQSGSLPRPTYLVPQAEPATPALSEEQLVHDVLFVFIHVNKAAGTFIKSNIIFSFLRGNKQASGAALGTFGGWGWVPGSNSSSPSTDIVQWAEGDLKKETEPSYFRCGRAMALPRHSKPLTIPPLNRTPCKMRFVWGALSLGLCDIFPGQPCVYFLVLRNPIERAFSDYNYFCVQGAENRKKWKPGWQRCPYDIVQYFDANVTSRSLLTERLTRGCDGSCGVEAALANLENPCVRYLLLDRVADGLDRLGDAFGPALRGSFRTLAANIRSASHSHSNASPYAPRTVHQRRNPQIVAALKERIQPDLDLYNAAVARYEAQWTRSLVSCNSGIA